MTKSDNYCCWSSLQVAGKESDNNHTCNFTQFSRPTYLWFDDESLQAVAKCDFRMQIVRGI